MSKLLVVVACFLGAMLVPFASFADGKKDCNGPLCDAYKHPQKRVLKPAPCVPIRFDQTKPDVVTIEVINPRFATRRKSDNFNTNGQYCFGEQWLRGATVTICNGDRTFKWTPAMVSTALAQNKKTRGLDGTLKGTKWYADHRTQYD